MLFQVLYYPVRLLGLVFTTAIGYLIVYIPLMCLLGYLINLFRDKTLFILVLPIVGLSIYVAYRMAKFADSRLPRLIRPKQSNPKVESPSGLPVNELTSTG